MNRLFAHEFWGGWREMLGFFRQYWAAYQGWSKLVRSPYFHLSLALTAGCFGLWTKPSWWETALMISPSILGFTLGGFAILLATATDKFGAILAKARVLNQSPLESPLGKLGGAFAHFIFVQFLSITYAVFAKAAYSVPAPKGFAFLSSDVFCFAFWGLGFLICVYALACAVGTTEWIFRSVMWLVSYHKKKFKLERERGLADE